MAPKVKSHSNYTNIILFIGLLLISGYLYNRYQNKQDILTRTDNYDSIRKYLLTDPDTDGTLHD